MLHFIFTSATWYQRRATVLSRLLVKYNYFERGKPISFLTRPSSSMASDGTCYTVVFESSAEYPSASELRQSLEKGSDEVKMETLRKIIVSTINGNPQVCILVDTNSTELRAYSPP